MRAIVRIGAFFAGGLVVLIMVSACETFVMDRPCEETDWAKAGERDAIMGRSRTYYGGGYSEACAATSNPFNPVAYDAAYFDMLCGNPEAAYSWGRRGGGRNMFLSCSGGYSAESYNRGYEAYLRAKALAAQRRAAEAQERAYQDYLYQQDARRRVRKQSRRVRELENRIDRYEDVEIDDPAARARHERNLDKYRDKLQKEERRLRDAKRDARRY